MPSRPPSRTIPLDLTPPKRHLGGCEQQIVDSDHAYLQTVRIICVLHGLVFAFSLFRPSDRLAR
jgi:hypothetical protein